MIILVGYHGSQSDGGSERRLVLVQGTQCFWRRDKATTMSHDRNHQFVSDFQQGAVGQEAALKRLPDTQPGGGGLREN
jgi:hypothetical protein